MGAFVAGPLSVADALAYDAYNLSVMQAMRQLAGEGKLPNVHALEDFLELSDRVRRQVRADAQRASAAGEDSFDVAVSMTAAEHRTLEAMGPTLQVVLEIATMRGTVDSRPPEGAFRLMTVLGRGTYRDGATAAG